MNVKESVQAQLTSILTCSVYKDRLPAGVTLPAASWQRVDHLADYCHDGFSGVSNVRIQVDLWSDDESEVEISLAELRLGMDGFTGALGGVGGVVCGSAIMARATDMRDPDTDWFRCSVDYILSIND